MSSLSEIVKTLNSIGIELSTEKDTDRLIEKILLKVKEITNADGGSIYAVTEDKELEFKVIINDTLDIYMGGSSDVAISFPRLKIFHPDGSKITNMVVARCYHDQRAINIPDVYETSEFDTSGTLKFDQQTGYRTRSNMTIPLINHENDVIGVLQLINRLDEKGEVVAFSKEDMEICQSLASQAAVAITNKTLIHDLKNLFESFIKMLATAIDEKSPYTGSHCRKVPVLTMMLADAVNDTQEGPLKDFSMDEKDRYELQIAGWLHDCGKVTTPEYVMDKATKLETIFDRIELVKTRFEVKFKELENEYLKARIQLLENGEQDKAALLEENYLKEIKELQEYLEFIEHTNIGGEFLSDEAIEKLQKIARIRWQNRHGALRPLLTSDELYNLSIRKGTLTAEERQTIQNHMVATIKILEALPFPKHLQNVPEYAGGHHERMDGKGYPKGLVREQMSVQARVMAIADIFEALSAADRPYKKGKTLSECLFIMGKMKQDNHIDPDLFDVFIDKKVYLHYAQQYMQPGQIDEVDTDKIPGYIPPHKRGKTVKQ